MTDPQEQDPPAYDNAGGRIKSGGGSKTAWRKVLSNASIILGERAAFGVVNIAAAAVAARAVGFEAFGAVMLVHAYARLFADVLRFQSWQAVLRYGAPALANDAKSDLRRLLGLTLWLDILALTVAIVLAFSLSGFAASLFNWPEQTASWAPWYVLAIPFIATETLAGALRLLDRFGILAVRHALTATIRLVGAALVWIVGLEGGTGAAALIAVWFLANVLSGLWMIGSTLLILRARGLPPKMRGCWTGIQTRFPRFWSFVLTTNGSSTLMTLIPNATTLVVGQVLGPAAAGLFGVVRQVADSVGKPAKLMGPVIFPELGRLRAENRLKSVNSLILRALAAGTAAVAAIALVMSVAGEPILVAAFGSEALAAGDLLILATTASSLAIWGFALESALLSAGRAALSFTIQCIATALYAVILLYFLSTGGGLTEVGIALMVQAAVVFLARLAAVWVYRRA